MSHFTIDYIPALIKNTAKYLRAPSLTLIGLTSVYMVISTSAVASLHLDTASDTQTKLYNVEDFSEDYSAVITVQQNGDYPETTVNIIDKATGQTVLSQPSDIDIKYELKISEEMNKGDVINANVAQSPYGHFSGIIYDDFNFDNQKDIAIKDGRMGCYGGPSYQVYLKQGDGFIHSEAFTELAQGYCGFFYRDKDNQTLHTMTKSGAAWHQYSTFKVIDNKPVAVRIIEEEWQSGSMIHIIEKTRVNGKMHIEEYMSLPKMDATELARAYHFSYDLTNGKSLVLGSNYDGELYYAFANKEGKVELYYNGQFVYDTTSQTLSFTNSPAKYEINQRGITVKLPNQRVVLQANPATVQGELDRVIGSTNVQVK